MKGLIVSNCDVSLILESRNSTLYLSEPLLNVW